MHGQCRHAGFDVIVAGEARRVTDRRRRRGPPAFVGAERIAAQPDDSGPGINPPFNAPTLGPPPWFVYEVAVRTATAVGTAEDTPGSMRWRCSPSTMSSQTRADGVRVVDGAYAHTDHFVVGDNRVDIVLDSGATSSLWWATKNEWLGLIDVAGLEVEALYGDFDRSPADENSGEYVFVVRPIESGHRDPQSE